MKVEALNQRGLDLKNCGELLAAEQQFRLALQRDATFLPALGNLAVVLRLLGRSGEALPLLEQLVRRAPTMGNAHYSLGNVYADLRRYAEAIASFRRAIGLNPQAGEYWVNLGNAHLARHEREDALNCFRQAAARRPDLYEAQYGLAREACYQSFIGEGLAAAEWALAIDPRQAPVHATYGALLRDIGLGGQAAARYRQAMALDPDEFGYFDGLLMVLTYLGGDEHAWFAEHRRYASLRETVPMLPPVVPATRGDRAPLRIGYVSGDFRAHSMAYFTWPLFRHHDRQRFTLYGYFTGAQADTETARFAATFDHWRDVAELDDTVLAEQIRNDGIDILIDLSSHTIGGRLGVFARRPAPVQVTWLGYAATTGLSRIDWRLTDAVMDPPGTTESTHSERLFRLEGCSYCFSPSPNCPEPGPLPALAGAGLTLASFANSAKLNDETIALWARVLAALPDARLRLFVYGGDEPPIADLARRRFGAHGIDPRRIEPFGKRTFFEFLRLHHEVDLALDPMSFSGVTTTAYTLWMGVPVVTLPGQLSITRASASLLTAVGLSDFVARDVDDYIDIVRRAATEPARLAALRSGMRDRLASSSLFDHVGFTRRLEAAFEAMWRAYQQAPAAARTALATDLSGRIDGGPP